MKLVLVEWEDPCSTSDPIWQHRENIQDLDTISCITVGIVLEETNEVVKIVLGLNANDFSQAITISKSCVKRIRELKVRRE